MVAPMGWFGTGDKLKVVRVEFSILKWAVFVMLIMEQCIFV
jgi:hypothetical protein